MNARNVMNLASVLLVALLLVEGLALPSLAFAQPEARAAEARDTLAASATSAEAGSDPDATATVGVPRVPVVVTRGASFVVTGTLLPRHETTSSAVWVDCLRLQSGSWVNRKTVAATLRDSADGGSAYSATVALPYGGSWRLRARHADEGYAPSWSPASSTIRSVYTKDAAIWNRDGVSTLPERMRYRLDARQMVVVTANNLDAHYGTLQVFEYRNGDWVSVMSAPARFGRRALVDGLKRRAGTLTTPTGIRRMPGYVFGWHSAPPSGTKMAFRRITNRSWWSSEHNSTYNTWVETSRHVSGEHLLDARVQYEFGVSSGYNALPNRRVYGRGSGIFIHVYGPRGALTAGCVSISRANMIRLFRTLDPAKRPTCAIGTMRSGTATGIYSY